MKQSLILDTNMVLRFVLNDVPEQVKEVETILAAAKTNKVEIHIPQIVVFEIQFCLEKYYEFSKLQISFTLRSLFSAEYIKIPDKPVFLETLHIYKTETCSFVDCFLLAFAKENNFKLHTFDKKLQKALTKLNN